jgi:hypothetical protein
LIPTCREVTEVADSRACADFEAAWQTCFDESVWSEAAERAVSDHIPRCARCRALDQGYRRLWSALQEGPRAVSIPPECTERLVAACDDEVMARQALRPRRAASSRGLTRAWPWAAVAAVGLISLGSWLLYEVGAGRGERSPLPPAGPPVRSLADSLLDATSATWSLARTTSLPAARAGRHLLVSAPQIQPQAPLAEVARQPRRVIRAISTGVMTGVQPISDSARRAFGFLVEPATEEPESKRAARRGV